MKFAFQQRVRENLAVGCSLETPGFLDMKLMFIPQCLQNVIIEFISLELIDPWINSIIWIYLLSYIVT